jgi:gluconokinase
VTGWERSVPVAIVQLEAPEALIRARVGSRRGHFAGADLVASQFATLEPLAPNEAGLAVDASGTPAAVVRSIRDGLGL